MENKHKLTFGQKLKFSIFDFEKYQDLAAEKIMKTIIYISIIMILFSLVVAGIYTYKFTATVANFRQYIENNIETISLEDNKITIIPKNGEEITTIENESLGVKVIVNAQTDDNEKINKSIDEIKSTGNGILILKDRILVKSEILNTPYSYLYDDIIEQYNINKLDKQELLNLLKDETIRPIYFIFYIIMFIYMFIIYLSSALVDIVVLSLFGCIVSWITRMRLKYSAIYNIAAYALTLPIILNIVYFVINSFTGFTIKYFEVMYTTVATIYIATAILMIRSDMIKQQIELTRIIGEQEKIREELRRKEEEEKEQEEKEERKKEDNKPTKKERDEKDRNLGKEPEGDNG